MIGNRKSQKTRLFEEKKLFTPKKARPLELVPMAAAFPCTSITLVSCGRVKESSASFQFGPPKTIGIFRTVPTFSRNFSWGDTFLKSYLSMDKYQNGDVTNLTPITESWTDFFKKSFGWNRPPVPTVAKKIF